MQKIKFSKFELAFKIVLTIFVISIFCFIFFCESIVLRLFGHGEYIDIMSGDFQVSFIDVKQGDCTLIKYKNISFVIDTGESVNAEGTSSSLKNLNGKDDIDYLILTHSDSDHVGGAKRVFDEFNVKNLLRPKVLAKGENETFGIENDFMIETNTHYNDAINSAYKEKECKISYINTETIFENEEFLFEILYPDNDDLNKDDENSYSAVAKVVYKGQTFLFMADADFEIEQKLIKRYGDKLNCDVLKVAHHGSNEATSVDFLNVATPKYSVISVGEKGIKNYGHAGEELKKRIYDSGSAILQTSKNGNILFGESINENCVCIKNFPSLPYAIISVICAILIFVIWGVKIKNKEKKNKSTSF